MAYRSFLSIFLSLLLLASPLSAAIDPNAFTGTDLILPAAGRIQATGAEFYTSVWVTNPTSQTVDFQMQFLRTGQSNPSPVTVADSIAPGATKVYERIVQNTFGISGVLGAVRIVSSGELLVSSRIYSERGGSTGHAGERSTLLGHSDRIRDRRR